MFSGHRSRLDLNEELRAIDRAADRRASILVNQIAVRATRAARSDSPLDLAFAEQSLAELILDAMVAAHFRAMDIFQPTYALSKGALDKALSQQPKQVRDAVTNLYRSVANAAASKPVNKVRDALLAQADATSQGKAKGSSIRTALKSAGIEFEDSPLIRTVLRTQTSLAFNAALWGVSQSREDLWGYEYQTAGDEKVRPTHQEFEPRGVGVRYPKDDPFWQRYAPPNGWNCRCGLQPLYYGDPRARKREFIGTPQVDPSFQFNSGVIFSDANKNRVAEKTASAKAKKSVAKKPAKKSVKRAKAK